MLKSSSQRLALCLFALYLAVFPGSTMTVALDRVPAWGAWMGAALLIVQGSAVFCWLLDHYGRHGFYTGLAIFLLGWLIEHIGVTTSFPFGPYYYTDVLQPHIIGAVPLAIICAWLMIVIGTWQISRWLAEQISIVLRCSIAATLVLLIDLQIELIATKINRYWIWTETGAYYGIPNANFVAWWLVGWGMALIVTRLLHSNTVRLTAPNTHALMRYGLTWLPTYLYVLSTLMFTVVNLVRGYVLAGSIGVVVLALLGCAVMPRLRRVAASHPN